jgi:hypothetical protein
MPSKDLTGSGGDEQHAGRQQQQQQQQSPGEHNKKRTMRSDYIARGGGDKNGLCKEEKTRPDTRHSLTEQTWMTMESWLLLLLLLLLGRLLF